MKKSAVIFANFSCLYFNYCIDIGEFLQVFKQANILPADNKKEKCDKTNKASANVLPSCMNILIKYFYRVNVDPAKDIALGIAL